MALKARYYHMSIVFENENFGRGHNSASGGFPHPSTLYEKKLLEAQ